MAAMARHDVTYAKWGDVALRRGPPVAVVPPSQQQRPQMPWDRPQGTEADECFCGHSKRLWHNQYGQCTHADACPEDICAGETRLDESPFPTPEPTPAQIQSAVESGAPVPRVNLDDPK